MGGEHDGVCMSKSRWFRDEGVVIYDTHTRTLDVYTNVYGDFEFGYNNNNNNITYKCRFSRRPGRARVGTLAESTTTTAIMKTAAADPYEFFRWKSSCGRLVVRTTWVSGVRHVLLSDDDKSHEKEIRLQTRRRTAHVVDRGTQSSRIVDDHDDEDSEHNCNDDDNYVERVLQWLQKPSVELDARRKPMSAPGSDARGCRRPALVKTCSIPERHSPRSEHWQAIAVHDERPMTTTRSGIKSRHKTELHVHMPSVLQRGGPATTGDNGKIADDFECY